MVITKREHTSNCSPDADNPGGKGTTLWFSDDVTIPPTSSYTWSFTDTKPCCYDEVNGTDLCLIVYDVVTTQDSPDLVGIGFNLNGADVGRTVHSPIAGHNITEAFDLVNSGHYLKGQQNSITFVNGSIYTPVQIKNFRVVRAYPIFGLNQKLPCNDPSDAPANGSLDYTRQDFPCNYDSYGIRMSFIPYKNDNHVPTIAPHTTATWQLQHPNDPSDVANYIGPYACFINFNKVDRETDLAADLHYRIKLNGVTIADYYHGGFPILAPSQYPTVDLAKFPSVYNDSPGAINTIEMENLGDVNLQLNVDTQGGVDVYRFYKAKNICQDDFSNINQYDYYWESVLNGGSVAQASNQLQVAVTSGSGWRQGGVVTRHACDRQAFYPGSNQQGFEASIDVTSVGALKEMAFLISGEKTTNQDPAALNNWYRILKNASNSTIMVQNRLNGGTVSTKLSKPWTSSTGQLRVKISTGSIAFYEGGQILYAEPFALPSNNCYIYAYTNSNQNGTGTFDNFEIIPAQNFRADFQNGSLDGWTTDAGSWAIQNGRLQSYTNGSFIHYNTQFHTNRHVRADIQTLSSDGVNPWDVAWLIAKAVDGNNRIYGLINTDGRVELSLWYNGQHTVYSASSSLSPYDQHSMAISIIGNNAKLWVDGQLYIDQDNDHFDDIHEGYIGFYSNGSTAAYDNIAVLNGDGATEGCQNASNGPKTGVK